MNQGIKWLADNDIDFKCKRKSAGRPLVKEDLAAFVQVWVTRFEMKPLKSH